MVRMKGLEPSRLAAQRPQRCASTNSATSAKIVLRTFRSNRRPRFGLRKQTICLFPDWMRVTDSNCRCTRLMRPVWWPPYPRNISSKLSIFDLSIIINSLSTDFHFSKSLSVLYPLTSINLSKSVK